MRWSEGAITNVAEVPDLQRSPTGTFAVADGVRLVETATDRVLASWDSPLRRVVWAGNGSRLVGDRFREGVGVVVDIPSGRMRELPSVGDRHGDFAVSPDGKELLVVVGLALERIDLDSATWVSTEPGHRHFGQVLGVASDGQTVVSGDQTGLRYVWHPGKPPVELATPVFPPPSGDGFGIGAGPQVPHAGEFSSDGVWFVHAFDGGVFTVNHTSTGAQRLAGSVDVDVIEGPHFSFDVTPVPQGGASCGVGEKRWLPRPRFTPDGKRLVTTGGGPGGTVVQVWDVDRGEVVNRYVFDSQAQPLGFRADGRVVVWAGDSLFALTLTDGEPELLATGIVWGWMDGSVPRWAETHDAIPSMPPPTIGEVGPMVVGGKVVFPDR